MRHILPLLLCAVFAVPCASAADTYDGRIASQEILTPLPGPAPRINGPALYGARPGRQFLYRIPCQGERPIQFEVKGLPDGLVLDGESGIITGMCPTEKGRYPMTFTARNAHGSTERVFALVLGDTLALTPPVGWNSWGGHMLTVSDRVMRKAADLIVESGLADVGFQYVSIDDCWMRVSQENYDARNPAKRAQQEGFDFDGLIGEARDAEGNILPNKYFPDMKAMTAYIHAHGLKVGLYSSPGPYTCQNFAGSLGHEEQDAAQYARWGFDLLKYDQCSAGAILNQLKKQNPDFQTSDFWRPMVRAIAAQDRDIVFNLCQYGQDDPWTWAPALGIQTWRIGGDLNHNVETYFEQALRIATELREFSKPGQWNDPDYMYIHRIRDHRHMVAPTLEIPLDTNERYQYATLWAMIAAPFFFSCDIDAIDEFTIRLLGNADVLGINQDELGHVAEVVRHNDGEVAMVKNLANGSRAIALFNTDSSHEAQIRLGPDLLGNQAPKHAFDVWRQCDAGTLQAGGTVRLSPSGVALFILSN